VSTVLTLLDAAHVLASLRSDEFIQQTINGLTLGSVYALIALGYSMVYGVLKLLNFAHGDVYMVGAFIGFGMIQWLGYRGEGDVWAPVLSTWFVLFVVFVAAMAGTAGLGVAIERFAYRPLRDAPRIAPLISALGVSFFIAYSMQLMFGAQQRDYNVFGIDDGRLFLTGWDIPFSNVRLPLLRILIIVSAFALMVALWLLVTRTRTGKAMRATSFDREAAAMMGIDIDRVIVFTFVLGSALAGAAGVMFSLRAPASVTMGFIAGLKGFTAAVIGGIGSIPGAMGGGLILGLAEAYSQGYISSKWSDLLVFVILIGFMLFRPQGLFGKADIRKV
jgi:branched-chain amino acid transport system permease protein